MNTIVELTTEPDFRSAFPVLQELRAGLEYDHFREIYGASRTNDGYTLVGIREGSGWAALMGYRTLWDFVHGKHLYVDDLVVTEAARSRGLGARLLRYAEARAAETGCTLVRLCTGVQNTRGMRFYEREAMEMRAVVYKKKVDAR